MLDMPPPHSWIHLVDDALREDLGSGDVTSNALVPDTLAGSARLEARQPLVAAGLAVAARVFERCDARLEVAREDGAHLAAGTVLAEAVGPTRGILAAERTALNFLQHLSGIATLTRRFCEAVQGTGVAIVDTRKTLPGWRTLERFAVRCGGGINHRMGLYDAFLIKDNHIAAVGSIGDAVKRARAQNPSGLRIQIEIESEEAARLAIEAGTDALLIDNQSPERIAAIAARARSLSSSVWLEASGRVSLEDVAAVARSGVDRISIGALTHSAPAVDIGLEWNVHSSS